MKIIASLFFLTIGVYFLLRAVHIPAPQEKAVSTPIRNETVAFGDGGLLSWDGEYFWISYPEKGETYKYSMDGEYIESKPYVLP